MTRLYSVEGIGEDRLEHESAEEAIWAYYHEDLGDIEDVTVYAYEPVELPASYTLDRAERIAETTVEHWQHDGYGDPEADDTDLERELARALTATLHRVLAAHVRRCRRVGERHYTAAEVAEIVGGGE